MKKLTIYVLCALMTLSLVACGGKNKTQDANGVIGGDPATWRPVEDETTVQPASPFIDCSTLEEAAHIAGFDMTIPETIEGYSTRIIQAIDNEMIQAIYTADENDIMIRKAALKEDISGDYTTYDSEEKITVDDVEITVKGYGETKYLATWINGEFSYSVQVSVGTDMESIMELVHTVK